MPPRGVFVAIASLLVLMSASPRLSSQAQTQSGSYGGTIRVGLVRSFRNAKQITVTVSANYDILKTGSSDKLASYKGSAPATIQIVESHLSIAPASGDPVPGGTSVTVSPSDPSAAITIGSPGLQSRRYRGKIEVSMQPSGLLVVDVLDIEDYLPGVLVGEMPSSFPDEALKSQAVAARCYTLCSRGKHDSSGFDVCDSVHCQVFDGCLRETPKIASAVSATKGQVLTYKGEIASVMYHSDCGGTTEDYASAHEKGSHPYLCCVTEPAGVPYSTWEKSYKPADLAAKLVAAGIKEADGLEKMTITKTSKSGRALEVGITGAKVSVMVDGSRLRMILGASIVKSTLFTIETADNGTITFKGKGHGHGIGMSQVGAKALAAAPFNYTYAQILDHYFPGTTLSPAAAGAKTATGTKAQQSARTTAMDPSPALGVRVQEPGL